MKLPRGVFKTAAAAAVFISAITLIFSIAFGLFTAGHSGRASRDNEAYAAKNTAAPLPAVRQPEKNSRSTDELIAEALSITKKMRERRESIQRIKEIVSCEDRIEGACSDEFFLRLSHDEKIVAALQRIHRAGIGIFGIPSYAFAGPRPDPPKNEINPEGKIFLSPRSSMREIRSFLGIAP